MKSSPAVIVVFVLAAGGAAFVLWRGRHQPAPPAPPPTARPAPAPAPPPPAPVAAPAPPGIEHPMAPEPSPEDLPDLDASDIYFRNALGDLLGKKSVASFLSLDGFARRVVATVNNLDTDTPAVQLWPVNRTPGSLEVNGTEIAAGNAARYAPFVRLAAGIDATRAVALYRRAYPLLQKAYEDLGFPGKYFNDRVVAVLDHLLATPEPAGPIKIKRAEVAGAPAGTGRSLYLFEDPTLESRSFGQKLLLRVGPDNARTLKAKLAEVRRLVARGPGATPP